VRGVVSLLDQLLYLGFGSALVATDKITFGDFVALGLYRQFVSSGFSEMQDFASSLLNVRTAVSRLEGVVDPDVATPTHEQSIPIPLEEASLRFENVMFRYSAFDEPVISAFDMTIGDGECVAIVGPSGSGKSTIAKLCTGGLKPTKGAVFIGGIQFNEQNEDALLAHLGTVMQADHLITASIFENISFHRDLSLETVQEAARLACIDEFIMGLPMRYLTSISDEYSAISGGQRQRILLARAIAANPRILVMDEATSALDADTELKIANNIRSMTMTRIIFAHRAETIRIADRVITIGQRG
jgi:ABC-type bacteriocin/lantibiotic exporter with double-glycine peptidase domain